MRPARAIARFASHTLARSSFSDAIGAITSPFRESPLVARSVPVLLRGRVNTIKFFNVNGYAPDLDRITMSPIG